MIVVTGGAGFIGSAFLWKLNREGIEDVIVVDELKKDEKWKNLRKKIFSRYIEKDDFIKLLEEDKIKDIETIVHLGACTLTTEDNASYMMETNYEY